MSTGEKIERKNLAHFIDESFNATTPNYGRLGKDLESYNIEMNAETEETQNILGETSFNVKGYKPSVSVDTYYAYEGSALYTKLKSIIDNRSTGSQLQTTVVDVPINVSSDGNVTVGEDTYREDVVVVPTSLGGDTGGVQIPFEIHYVGNRTKGTFDLTTKKFTEAAKSASGSKS